MPFSSYWAMGPEHPVVVPGHDLLEAGDVGVEGRQDLLPPGGAGGGHMGLNEGAELGDVVRLRQGVRHHLVLVEAHIEVVLFVQHIGDAAGHPGCEVLSRGAKNHAAACRSCTRSHGPPRPPPRRWRRSCGRRTARRAIPLMNAWPEVAPYRATLPTMMFSPGRRCCPWVDRVPACRRRGPCPAHRCSRPPAPGSVLWG